MTDNIEQFTSDLMIWFTKNHSRFIWQMKQSNHNFSHEHPNPFHLEDDVWSHTMMVTTACKLLDGSKVQMIASLFHDLGKPHARQANTDTHRVGMPGHAGLSAYMSVNMLREMIAMDWITRDEAIEVLSIVANHFDFFKIDFNGKKTMSKFSSKDAKALEGAMDFSLFDHHGRHFTPNTSGSYDRDAAKDFIERLKQKHSQTETCVAKCTFMIGPPGVGKSTYVAKHFSDKTVISRDALIEAVDPNSTYNENWNNCDQSEIDKLLDRQIANAIKSNEDFVIDMTLMSKKSRRKMLNKLPKHFEVDCVVLFEDYEVLLQRMEQRQREGKNIPRYVIDNMIKGFAWPMHGEGFSNIVVDGL